MAQPLQSSSTGQASNKIFIFRILGSVYEEKAGEETSVPTVIEVKVSAKNKPAAQNRFVKLFHKLSELVAKEEMNEVLDRMRRDSEAMTKQGFLNQPGQGTNIRNNKVQQKEAEKWIKEYNHNPFKWTDKTSE